MILRSTINTRQTLSTFHCININVYYISICMFLRKHISGVDDCGKQGADRPRILVGEYEDITAPKSSCESGCSFLFKTFCNKERTLFHDRRESSPPSWQIGFKNSCDMWVISNLAFALAPFPVSSMVFHPLGNVSFLLCMFCFCCLWNLGHTIASKAAFDRISQFAPRSGALRSMTRPEMSISSCESCVHLPQVDTARTLGVSKGPKLIPCLVLHPYLRHLEDFGGISAWHSYCSRVSEGPEKAKTL